MGGRPERDEELDEALPGRRSDRRLARGSATRGALVRATAELIRAGVMAPTSGQVADQAGVSRRLVFYYFPHVEALVTDAVAAELSRCRGLLEPVRAGPRDVRIDVLCRRRRELFEAVGPVFDAARRRAGDASGGQDRADPSSAAVHQVELRGQVAATFAPELARAGPDAATVLSGLETICGWDHWRRLRRWERLDPAAAQTSVASLLRRVLAG